MRLLDLMVPIQIESIKSLPFSISNGTAITVYSSSMISQYREEALRSIRHYLFAQDDTLTGSIDPK
jgi:hypothetical protein